MFLLKVTALSLSIVSALVLGKEVDDFNPARSQSKDVLLNLRVQVCRQKKRLLAKLYFLSALLADWLNSALFHVSQKTTKSSKKPPTHSIIMNIAKPFPLSKVTAGVCSAL